MLISLTESLENLSLRIEKDYYFFLANLLGLDADDSIDKNTLKMLMYTDPIIFPLDEEGLPEPSIHKLDKSMFTIDD